MRSFQRPMSALITLVLLITGFFLSIPAAHAVEHDEDVPIELVEEEPVAGSEEPPGEQLEGAPAAKAEEVPTELVELTPRTHHTFETGNDFTVRSDPESPHPDETGEDNHGEEAGVAAQGPDVEGAAAFPLSRSGDIKVKLVTVRLADDSRTVDATSAINSVNHASNYWKRMSNNRLSMSVASTKWAHVSKAKSTWSQTDIMNQVTNELGWRYSPYTALVVFTPSNSLANGTLGYGWSSNGTSGRILMPQISSFTTNVVTHEFGHVLGLIHADALQCAKGQQDIPYFDGSGCYIREYGDTLDVMGTAQYTVTPNISASFWDYGAFGRGDEISNAGVASGSKTWKLLPWGGTAPRRAVKFTDPRSKEVYFLEFRAPVGYDASNAVGGNYGVKITQSGGGSPASSLILMPSTVPFNGYYAPNHAWKPGWTFTTHGGTKVKVNSMTTASASITITAPPTAPAPTPAPPAPAPAPAPKPAASKSRMDMNGDGTPDLIARDSKGRLWLYPTNTIGGFKPRTQIGTGWSSLKHILQPGDFTGNGTADVMAVDRDGNLRIYEGTGTGSVRSSRQVGSGWGSMTALVTPGDFNGDRFVDVIARDRTGKLFLYPGNGKGGWKPRTQIGTGWQGMTAIFSTGDFNGDNISDLLTRDGSGRLFLYPGNGRGGFGTRSQPGHGWQVMTSLVGPGAWRGSEANEDVVARNSRGELFLYNGNGRGGFSGSKRIGHGWNGIYIVK